MSDRRRAERCVCPNCHGRGTVAAPLDLARHVPALVGTIGGLAFSTRELLAHAQLEGRELHGALKGREPRAIGKALERLSGQIVDGIALQRVGSDGKAAIWMFVPESELR